MLPEISCSNWLNRPGRICVPRMDNIKGTLEQVKAYGESFRTAEIRFNAGAITSVDYVIAKNNFDRANINLSVATV